MSVIMPTMNKFMSISYKYNVNATYVYVFKYLFYKIRLDQYDVVKNMVFSQETHNTYITMYF